MNDLVTRLFESDAASALTNEAARYIEKLEKALNVANEGLFEAEDKFNVAHYNHPADRGLEHKDSLAAQHAREDRHMLFVWSEKMHEFREEVQNILK